MSMCDSSVAELRNTGRQPQTQLNMEDAEERLRYEEQQQNMQLERQRLQQEQKQLRLQHQQLQAELREMRLEPQIVTDAISSLSQDDSRTYEQRLLHQNEQQQKLQAELRLLRQRNTENVSNDTQSQTDNAEQSTDRDVTTQELGERPSLSTASFLSQPNQRTHRTLQGQNQTSWVLTPRYSTGYVRNAQISGSDELHLEHENIRQHQQRQQELQTELHYQKIQNTGIRLLQRKGPLSQSLHTSTIFSGQQLTQRPSSQTDHMHELSDSSIFSSPPLSRSIVSGRKLHTEAWLPTSARRNVIPPKTVTELNLPSPQFTHSPVSAQKISRNSYHQPVVQPVNEPASLATPPYFIRSSPRKQQPNMSTLPPESVSHSPESFIPPMRFRTPQEIRLANDDDDDNQHKRESRRLAEHAPSPAIRQSSPLLPGPHKRPDLNDSIYSHGIVRIIWI